MFEQSMLLDSGTSKKAGALAISLTTQTVAVGALLLIPLIYTDRLPFAQLQINTFLPPPLPPERPRADPVPTSRTLVASRGRIFAPTSVPPLDTRPEIAIDMPGPDLMARAPDIGTVMPSLIGLPYALPPPPVVAVETAPPKPLTVTSEVQAAKLLRRVVPIYPRLAIMARISGTVRLIGRIGTEGTIEHLQVISGPPLLVAAAVDAVRQWLYRPTLLNGKPVEVIAPIDVIFTLTR